MGKAYKSFYRLDNGCSTSCYNEAYFTQTK